MAGRPCDVDEIWDGSVKHTLGGLWPSSPTALRLSGTAPGAKSRGGQPRAAPELGLVALDGARHSLANYEGRVILVNLWAVWCPRCRKEMPALVQPVKHFQGEAFEMVGVNLGESVEPIRDFLKTLPVPGAFPMLLNPGGSVLQA